MSGPFVAYYRVSTDRQGRSGLGLEAQQAAVRRYLGTETPIAEFTEVETGKRNDRPQLHQALALCRKQGQLERNLDLEHASYFVSRMQIIRTKSPGMAPWRKAIFVFMARNASSPLEDFALPGDRTVIMGSQVNF